MLSMTPRFAMNDRLNIAIRCRKLRSERFHCHVPGGVQASDFLDLTHSQTAYARRFATGVSVFCHHVCGVFCRGSEKQVGGPNTCGVVAVVADEHAIRNCAVCQFPRNAMGAPRFTAYRDDAIPRSGPMATPLPAGTSGIYVLPETIKGSQSPSFCLALRRCVPAFQRTQPSAGWMQSRRLARKLAATLAARMENAGPLRRTITGARAEASASIAFHGCCQPLKLLAAMLTCHVDKLAGHRESSSRCHPGGAPTPPGFPIHKPNFTTQAVS